MRLKYIFIVIAAAMTFSACDDTTEDIGTSLTYNMDNLNVTADTFLVSSRSIIADSVYSRSSIGYLGKIRDSETNGYITGNFMTQFHVLGGYLPTFPEATDIVSRTSDGKIIADSCELRLFYTSFYGDSLAPMKLRATEMAVPMLEDQLYYSSFNPKKEGYLRADGISKEKIYTLTDLNIDEKMRYDADSYTSNICIPLNDEYTDKNGIVYNNLGSYLMNTFYENPELYGNPLRFLKEVMPGFYFEHTGGLGSMAYINATNLVVYFRYEKSDSIHQGTVNFGGTEEVLQTTTIINDKKTIQDMASDNTCTYLKTPAGIFTEMTIPVDEILQGHDNDIINTAKIIIPRVNNQSQSDYALPIPTSILMIPKDSLYTFFENNRLVDNRHSYLASTAHLSTNNTYVFENISNLVAAMNERRDSEDWNKVVLIPVSTSSISNAVVGISHSMQLSSTRLVGGSDNPHDPIKISIIYSKFK